MERYVGVCQPLVASLFADGADTVACVPQAESLSDLADAYLLSSLPALHTQATDATHDAPAAVAGLPVGGAVDAAAVPIVLCASRRGGIVPTFHDASSMIPAVLAISAALLKKPVSSSTASSGADGKLSSAGAFGARTTQRSVGKPDVDTSVLQAPPPPGMSQAPDDTARSRLERACSMYEAGVLACGKIGMKYVACYTLCVRRVGLHV